MDYVIMKHRYGYCSSSQLVLSATLRGKIVISITDMLVHK